MMKFKNIKEYAQINTYSKFITSGTYQALSAAANLYYLENNQSFKLKDLLKMQNKSYQGLELKYTTYKDGSYSLRDTTYATPQVVMRVTLDIDTKEIEFVVDCSHLKISTHKKLREICIKRWGGSRIDEKISF